MATEVYLAMKQEEIAVLECPPAKSGWMDCCFSQTTAGLDRLPSELPEDALLILTDRFPFREHNSILIAEQLHQAVTSLRCSGILLDFETPGKKELTALAEHLVSALPCPVAVSESYAGDMNCPVFLPPCPHHIPLKDYIASRSGREIWLDLARDAECIIITASGSVVSPCLWTDPVIQDHSDAVLHCHYRIETGDDYVRFILRRTHQDLESLAAEAIKLGVKKLVGLYQELI